MYLLHHYAHHLSFKSTLHIRGSQLVTKYKIDKINSSQKIDRDELTATRDVKPYSLSHSLGEINVCAPMRTKMATVITDFPVF